MADQDRFDKLAEEFLSAIPSAERRPLITPGAPTGPATQHFQGSGWALSLDDEGHFVCGGQTGQTPSLADGIAALLRREAAAATLQREVEELPTITFHFPEDRLPEDRLIAALERATIELSRSRELRRPIPVILHCPECRTQHVDRDEWATRPHRTHLCAKCGLEWRASQVPTVGIEKLP